MHDDQTARTQTLAHLLHVLVALLSIPALPAFSSAPQRGLAREIEARVQAAGSYRFTTDVEQTVVPRPLSEMIGQTQQRVDLRTEGFVEGSDRAYLQIRVQGPDLDIASMTVVQMGGQVFVQQGDELLAQDNPLGDAVVPPTNWTTALVQYNSPRKG